MSYREEDVITQLTKAKARISNLENRLFELEAKMQKANTSSNGEVSRLLDQADYYARSGLQTAHHNILNLIRDLCR